MKNFNKIAITALLTLTFAVATQARSRPGTRSPEAGKGKIEADAAKEVSRKQGTAANAKTLEKSTSSSALDVALNNLVANKAADPATVTAVQAAVRSIKDANLRRDVETAIDELSVRVAIFKTLFEKTAPVSAHSHFRPHKELAFDFIFVKTALEFAASVKRVENFQGDREIMLTLLESLPKVLTWGVAEMKSFTDFLAKIVEGKESLQKVTHETFVQASRDGHVDIVKALLEITTLDVNFGGSHNDKTALMWASKKGNIEVVKVLLKTERIDVNFGDGRALSLATFEGYTEIVNLLKQAGAWTKKRSATYWLQQRFM